jgi:VanZ family protein
MRLKILSWFEKYNNVSLLITLFGAVLIFYFSSLTFGDSGYSIGLLSVVYHFLAFFCFSFFLFITLVIGKNKKFFVAGILIAVFYAISDEIHQFFVPGRCCSFFDIFIDSLGILCAFCLYYILMVVREN